MRVIGPVLLAALAIAPARAAQPPAAATPSGQQEKPQTGGQQQPPKPAEPAQQPAQPQQPPRPPAPEFVRQAQQALRDGHPDQALAVYEKELAASPDSFLAHNGAGIVLDLMGKYDEARKHFSKALEVASTPAAKAQAGRSMAISYAFENNCQGAAKYEEPLYESYLQAQDYYNAGEIADELARVCLEAGEIDTAEKWYRMGYAAGLQEPDIKPARKDLWDFRWEHAMARIAARRGDKEGAARHIAAAKAALATGTNPEQQQFLPYLTGYVAFYEGDYQTALADLQKANQKDPFILVLIAQTYEKLGDAKQATDYYQKALASNAHNPPTAYARPLARRKLGQS
ncbi:MAG: tetratricopeptide repeat protein [Betaproteobacteria bacterium]